MAVPVIALGCYSDANRKEQTVKWSDDKIKSLWSSLLDLESVSKYYEDLEVQGILLLLETIFNVFKNLKKKYDDAESTCQLLKRDLESAKEDLCQVKEDLKCHNKVFCERCPELERELGAYKKKLEYNETRIKSIVSILSMNNSSEDSDINLQSSPNTAIVKAYDLVSQMLLENNVTNMERDEICGVKSGSKRLGLESAESLQVRTPGRKRKKQNKMGSRVDTLNVKEKGDMKDLHYGATLAPESVPADERNVCSNVAHKIVPETLCSLPHTKFSDMENTVPQLDDICVTETADHIQTTPKKEALREKVTQRSSPILGSCGKRSTHKITHCNNSNVTIDDSAHDRPVLSQTVILNIKSDNDRTVINNCKGDVDRSPSLLKIQSGVSSSVVPGTDNVEGNCQERKKEKHGQNVSKTMEDNPKSTKVIKADFWKLKPTPHVNVNNRKPGYIRSCRLKQTTLSLACLPRKQDLCMLKEFNGGVRQSAIEGGSLADETNGDHGEEMSLKLAIRESLNENENRELGRSDDKSPGIRNLKVDPAEDDDDLVLASPDASHPLASPRQKHIHTRDRPAVIRRGDNTSINMSLKKELIQPATGSNDMDETMFVPLHTSTLQDGTYSGREMKGVPESEEGSEDDFKQPCNLADIKNRKESKIVRKHDCSFDRIPEKVSTSPDYKYRRAAVRNREARRKLDGWECEQCKNYYAITDGGADPTTIKRHLKQCSRHRDKYGFQTNTPPGFWNVGFPSTEESKLEDTLK